MRNRTSRRVRQFIATCAAACMLAFTLGATPATAHETSADTTAPEAQAIDAQQTTPTDQASPATAPTTTNESSSPIPDPATTAIVIISLTAIAVAIMPDNRVNVILNRRRRRAMSKLHTRVNDFTTFNRLARIVDKAVSGCLDRMGATKKTRPAFATNSGTSVACCDTIPDNHEAVGQRFTQDVPGSTITTMTAAETAGKIETRDHFAQMMTAAGFDEKTFAQDETPVTIHGFDAASIDNVDSTTNARKELITS